MSIKLGWNFKTDFPWEYHFEHNLKIAYKISVPCKLKLLWLLPVWLTSENYVKRVITLAPSDEFNWINQSASATKIKDEGAVVSSFQKLTI